MNSLPKLLFLIPVAAQGAALTWDEFYFHARRRLHRWERIGHPVDTLAFLACLALVAFSPARSPFFEIYVAAAIFSTLLVTKDEWVHARECPPGELWLHSVLFVLHPVVLITAAAFWPEISTPGAIRLLFLGYLGSVALFMAYQILYWNYFDERLRLHQQ